METIAAMISEVAAALGPDAVESNSRKLHVEMANTLGLKRDIAALIYPASTSEVQALARIAGRHRVGLYPVSRGMNIGYGDRVPAAPGQVLVSLERMKAIREVHEDLGYAVIEPGVTQEHLFRYLRDHNLPFWMDATGAGVDASIIGNTLDGGFGHTRLGNHRAEISGLEVVLGTGEILETGDFPGLGPDVSGIFVQSNLGIVTAMKVKLLPVPDHYESFVVKVDRDDLLEPLVAQVRKLRAENVLTSLVHIANATRSLVTTQTFPPGFGNQRVSCQQALELMNNGTLLNVGFWTAIGCLSGSRRVVAAHRHRLKKAFAKIGTVKFFTDKKISRVENFLAMPLFDKVRTVARLRESIDSLKYIHEIGKGIPSNKALNTITWRVRERKDLGLIWLSPVTPSSPEKVRLMLDIVDGEFAATAFEMPVTLTAVTDDKMVAIFSIIFDKTKEEEVVNAHRLYFSASAKLKQNGIHMYRSSILAMDDIDYPHLGKKAVLRQLKDALDPQGIISPGRYIS